MNGKLKLQNAVNYAQTIKNNIQITTYKIILL